MHGLRIVSTDKILYFIILQFIYLVQHSYTVGCCLGHNKAGLYRVICWLLFLLSDPYRVAMPPNKKGVYDNGDILYDNHTYPRGDTRPKVSAHVQVN